MTFTVIADGRRYQTSEDFTSAQEAAKMHKKAGKFVIIETDQPGPIQLRDGETVDGRNFDQIKWI